MRQRILSLLAFLLAGASVLWAAPPLKAADVPVFPGAVLDKDATQQAQDNQSGLEDLAPRDSAMYTKVVGNSIAAYVSSASPEEVFNWYVTRLSAVPEPHDGPAPADKVTYGADAYDPARDFVTKAISDTASTNGDLMKRSVQARPKTPLGWIKLGGFSWSAMSSRSDGANFAISIEDLGFSFSGNTQQYKQKSVFTITSVSYKVYPKWDLDARSKGLSDPQIASLEAIYDTPPTGAVLGAPAYPGATFDFDTLIRNPMFIGKGYFYLSSDALEKVTAFYEAKTGKRFVQDKQGLVILLKGTPAAPQQVLSVQSVGQTMIVFMNVGAR